MTTAAPSSQTVWDHHPALRAVQAAFDHTVASRQGRVTLLAGGAASGRSGLAVALAAWLHAHPARPVVVAGGFTPDGGWEPWPPRDPGRLVAPLQAGVDVAVKALELSGTLVLPPAAAAAKLLGQLASASSAAWTLLHRHAEGRQPLPGQTGPDAVRQVLRAATAPQPVVCILDDLDRAPTAGDWWHGLVLRLAAELRDLPVLLVATLDGPAVLGGHELGEPAGLFAARRLVEAGVGTWVPVGRLDVDAVASWLGPWAPEVAERLWEVTGGEPRWLGELWAHWHASRVVRRDLTGEWVLAGGDDPALGGVHDLVWERLARSYGRELDDDQLDRVVRMLAVGALEGREFTADAVAMVVGRDPDGLIDELDEHLLTSDDRPDGLLVEAGFMELGDPRATPDGDGGGVRAPCRYRFASQLHWRTLRRYGFLGEAERTDGCRALATALERVLQPEPERVAAQLASLWREAGDPQAAAGWQVQAELAGAAPAVEARARLLLAQDTAGWDRFDHAQTARQLEHAMMLLWEQRPAGVVLKLAYGWARAAQAAGWKGEYASALRHCGLLHDRRGERDDAVGCLRRARREATAAGDLGFAARTMADRAHLELAQGWVRVARRRGEAARQLARHHHAPIAEASALRLIATLAERARDWKGALAAATAGVAAAERAGDQQTLATLLVRLSEAQGRLGRVGQARETATRMLMVARQAGGRDQEGAAELLLGRLWQAEDPQGAQRHLLRGLAIARQLELHAIEVQCCVRLAALARDRGEVRAAQAELGQATRLANALGNPMASAWAWQGWAELAQAQAIPGGRAALLWALTAVHHELAGSAAAASFWEAAERAAAAAGEPSGRASLAARAGAALARDGGWGLLEEVFGPFDPEQLSGDQAGPGT